MFRNSPTEVHPQREVILGPGGTKFHWKQIESGPHVGVSHMRVIITCINTVFSCIKRGLDERVQLQSIPNLEGS